MRPLLVAAVLLAAALPAQAQFKTYFDISALKVAALTEPAWVRKQEEGRIRYMCVDVAKCAMPTALEIKGVLRAEMLPEAFEHGSLAPSKLKAAGDAKAGANSKFISAEPLTVAGRRGVQMEASADVTGGTLYYVSRWIGEGNRLLDVKAVGRDLKTARELADAATRELVPQVFDGT